MNNYTRDLHPLRTLGRGFRDGIPIGLGYLAVSFSLGIMAQKAGLTPFASFVTSILCNASAGEYAGFTVIASAGAYIEMALMTLVANLRYMLMSFAMSQRTDPKTGPGYRLLMSFYITDEIFAISIGRPGYLNPFYTLGAALIASPLWGLGTALGCIAGNVLPLRVVSALSVALYGMFLAIIVPPARKDKAILCAVLIAAVLSILCRYLIPALSEGFAVILCAVAASVAAALLFPRKDDEEEEGGV